MSIVHEKPRKRKHQQHIELKHWPPLPRTLKPFARQIQKLTLDQLEQILAAGELAGLSAEQVCQGILAAALFHSQPCQQRCAGCTASVKSPFQAIARVSHEGKYNFAALCPDCLARLSLGDSEMRCNVSNFLAEVAK